MDPSDRVAPWLEMELASELHPVEAPVALWDRIARAQIEDSPTPRRTPVRWALWPVAAMLLLTTAFGLVRQIRKSHDPAASLEKLAEQELREIGGNAGSLDFHSGDHAEIEGWVKAEANLVVNFPAGDKVRLLGARLIPSAGSPIAAIAYRVNNEAAALLVCRKRPEAAGNLAAPRHGSPTIATAGGPRLHRWTMGEQTYTLAASNAGACLLCHADARETTTLN
ncbi:MAG: hypothetical protein ABIZ80_09005 [Bryobacteraceae bacterium]